MKHLALSILTFISVFFLFDSSHAQLNQGKPAILNEIGVDENLGDIIPQDLRFVNSEGETVRIGDLIEKEKPVLLNPLYYECPILCGVVLDAVFKVVDELKWTPGKDYTIISFSIDPGETPAIAAESKREYLSDLDRPGAEEGWHFLTGTQESIDKLTEAIGFRYKYDESNDQYYHLASIMLLSPQAKVVRYLYGATFSEFNLRNALYEAADGKIGSAVDKAVLYCFSYDPDSQSYVPVALNIMKLGGLATVIILGIFLGVFWKRERNSSQPPKIEIDR
ncbi:MAG: SCO family protein [Balneolaceae bacterium]|nr:SCO family protein [Balneolaceae bacterium]MDR9407627.1 SCO family protein [Balneolaceae bacterium]